MAEVGYGILSLLGTCSRTNMVIGRGQVPTPSLPSQPCHSLRGHTQLYVDTLVSIQALSIHPDGLQMSMPWCHLDNHSVPCEDEPREEVMQYVRSFR